MIYCKIENDTVVNRAVFAGDMPAGWASPGDVWIASDTAQSGWAYRDGVFSAPPRPERPPPTEADYERAIQGHVDSVAQSKSYADGVSMAGYINSTVEAWAAEAQAFIAWRDSVWLYVYAQLAAVQGGQRAQPSVAELIAELPTIVWP